METAAKDKAASDDVQKAPWWRPTAYLYWQRRFERRAALAFERLGLWVATHRWWTMLGGAVFIALCGLGFLNFQILSDGDKLWSPSSSPSVTHKNIVDTYFGDADGFAQLLFRTADGSNLLTLAAFEDIWAVNEGVVTAAGSNGLTYSDLCQTQASGACDTYGVLRFWDYDLEVYSSQVTTEAELLAALSNSTFPDGGEVSRDQVFGLYETAQDGSLVSAQAVLLSYIVDGATHSKSTLQNWESAFQDEAKAQTADLPSPIEGFYLTSRSYDDELARSVGGEVYLFVIAFVLMILFVQLQLGKFDRVRGRKGLAFAGVVTVVLAGFAAYGVCSGFGVPFTSLVQIFPFLLLGVGVDDMLIITAHFDEEDPALPTNVRVSKALGKCGLSITYTSLASWLAFALGGIPQLTQLPAVRYFCWYASTSFLFDFLLQITVFVALLCWDADRMTANKLDVLFCVRSERRTPTPVEAQPASSDSAPPALVVSGEFLDDSGAFEGDAPPAAAAATLPATVPADANEASAKDKGEVGSGGPRGDGNPFYQPMNRFFYARYAPFLLRLPVKLLVIAITLGYTAVCIWGVTQVTQGFDVLDLVPDNSYARDFTTNAREVGLFLQDTYLGVDLYFEAVDYTEPAVQASMKALEQEVLTLQHCGGPLSSWLDSFVDWAGASDEYSDAVTSLSSSEGEEMTVFDDASRFYDALGAYLSTSDGERFTEDIVFASGGAIEISRVSLFYTEVRTASAQKSALLDLRNACSSAEGLDPEPFSYSPADLYSEQYIVLVQSVLADFGVALAAVGLLSFLVLGRIRYTLMVTALVGVADMMLIAALYFWGLSINTVTGIQLVMAAGLIIDYITHPTGHIVRTPESFSVTERVKLGLGEIGPSVLLGGCTTLLGVLPMAAAHNAIFRAFFRVFLCIVLYGVYFGLVVAPVLVTWIPFPKALPGMERHAYIDGHAAATQQTKGKDGAVGRLPLGSVTVVNSMADESRADDASAA